ncbi:MAG: hypothetical protein Q9169_000684 [Polycauliona sp. 2 TL-2023]
MPSDNAAAVAAFIEGAPPGELADVIADIQKLTVKDPKVLGSVTAAFQTYNEEQLSTPKLPESGRTVLISPYNSLGDGRYYDVESQKSFAFDHQSQKASDVRPYNHESEYSDLISPLLKSLSTHSIEHYPSATYTVCPTPSSSSPSNDTTIALLLVSNKYSPSNFWNGRYRSTYLFSPASSRLSGTINVDVHYYEDGNVRLTTTKKIPEIVVEKTSLASSSGSGLAAGVLKKIAGVEKAYQEELNRGFGRLSEGEFKGLRRQLPVTRQKVEWEKIAGYRLGQDIGGGRSR